MAHLNALQQKSVQKEEKGCESLSFFGSAATLCPVEFCQLKRVPTVSGSGHAALGTSAPARARRDFRPHTDGLAGRPARLEPGPNGHGGRRSGLKGPEGGRH